MYALNMEACISVNELASKPQHATTSTWRRLTNFRLNRGKTTVRAALVFLFLQERPLKSLSTIASREVSLTRNIDDEMNEMTADFDRIGM
jgi:hypothetical protein